MTSTRLDRLQEHLPAWLVERARSGAETMTDKLGGPARRRVIIILALILALDSADKGAVGAMAPQLEASFGIGNLDIGILATASSLIGAAASLPMGVLSDKTRRVRLLEISIVVWSVAEAVSGFSNSFIMLLLTRLALGAITATAGPAIGSLTGDFFPAAERSRIYGFILTGELLGAGGGLLISGDIGAAIGWRAGFIVLALPSLALAWVVHRYLPEPARGGQSWIEVGAEEIATAEEAGDGPDRVQAAAAGGGLGCGQPDAEAMPLQRVEELDIDPNPETVIHDDPDRMGILDALRWVLKVRTNVLLIVSSALGYFFYAGLKSFAVIFARGQYGISESIATLLAVAVGAAAIAGIIMGGRLADGWLGKGRVDARLIVAGIGYLAAALIFIPALLTHNLVLALPLVAVAAAALSGPNSPGDAARLDVVPSRMWGRTEAIRTFLRTLLEAFAPLLFGFVSQMLGSPGQVNLGSGVNNRAAQVSAASAHGLSLTFLVMLVPLAASGYFVLRARRSYPTDVASAAESEREMASGGAPGSEMAVGTDPA